MKPTNLDVRLHNEFAQGHIPGPLSVPLGELDRVLARLPKRAQIIKASAAGEHF